MNKTIVGRIEEKNIHETIMNYQENIPEQILTAKRKIRDKFVAQGYNSKDIVYESL